MNHRESAADDAAPRSLVPVATIALAALAVQVHGCELDIKSGYLPYGLLRAPEGTPRVAPLRPKTSCRERITAMPKSRPTVVLSESARTVKSRTVAFYMLILDGARGPRARNRGC